MYFDAALSYDESTGRGDADVLRVYSKCTMSSSGCRSIKDLIIDEWPSRRRAGVATHAPAPPVVPQAFGTINLPPPGSRYPSTTTSPSSSTGSTGLYPPTGGMEMQALGGAGRRAGLLMSSAKLTSLASTEACRFANTEQSGNMKMPQKIWVLFWLSLFSVVQNVGKSSDIWHTALSITLRLTMSALNTRHHLDPGLCTSQILAITLLKYDGAMTERARPADRLFPIPLTLKPILLNESVDTFRNMGSRTGVPAATKTRATIGLVSMAACFTIRATLGVHAVAHFCHRQPRAVRQYLISPRRASLKTWFVPDKIKTA